MTVTLTDHERRFADSPQGRYRVASAKRAHDMREAHKGNGARQWTDAMEVDAVRALATSEARKGLNLAAHDAAAHRALSLAEAARDASRVANKATVRDAWRGK